MPGPVLQRVALFSLLLFVTNTAAGADKVVSGEFVTEPPTLISLGFEWHIEGDDNRNAEVSVHKKGPFLW